MTDLNFADKYRPQTFAEVFGQESAVGCLAGLIRQGQKSRNILLHGAVGSGKTTLARLYARALNCLAPDPDGSPCRDRCAPCRSGDGREIAGFYEYNVSRDGGGMAEVRAWVKTHDRDELEFHYRILFFDEAQALTPGACDALLAAVERPRDRVLFFFATTEVERIRPALCSRLFDLLIRPLPDVEAIAFLRKYAAAEGVDHAPGALELLAGLRNGYPRDLLLGLDRVCEPGIRLTVERVRTAFDVDQTEVLLDYFAALADGDFDRQTEVVFAWRESEAERIRWIQAFLISLYHNDILHRRLVVDGIIAAIPQSARVPILDRFCRRLGLASHAALAPAWHRMMDFWTAPETATDATTLRLRLTLFHHLVNGMTGAEAERSDDKSPLPAPSKSTAPSRPTALSAASATVVMTSGFGPMPAGMRLTRVEEPGFLTVADVRQIINAASFLVQEHGVLLNATFEVRPARFGAEAPEAAAALIAAFRDDLAARAAAWGGVFASITVVERDALGIVGYLAAHLPHSAFHDTGDDEAAGPVEAWARGWRRGDRRGGGDAVRFAAAPVGEAAKLAFHWDAALELCAGLGEEPEALDPETGQRKSLLRLLGVHGRSTNPMHGTPLVAVSALLTDVAIAAACGDGLTPLSASDDGAWAWVRRGWERDEVGERQATRAERAAERARVGQKHGGDASETRAALAELERGWPVDPHARRRRWRGWWA